jgi:hypothetical protein
MEILPPLADEWHEKQSATALQIKILIEKTNDIYRYASSFKLNLVNHISIGVERSINGGDHIHIFVFTDLKNNRFQKKLIMQNTNIWIWPPPPLIDLSTPMHISLMFGWKDQIFSCNCFWDIAILVKALEFNHIFAILLVRWEVETL